MNGYIVKGIGGFYYVRTEAGIIECKPRGIFRKQKITPVAGDEVTVENVSDKFIVQWEEMKKIYPKAINLGSIF